MERAGIVGGSAYGQGVDRYERRNAEMVLAVRDAVSRYCELEPGDRLSVSGLGGHDGEFTISDVSEPDAEGRITLTFTERLAPHAR